MRATTNSMFKKILSKLKHGSDKTTPKVDVNAFKETEKINEEKSK